jgi:RNA polymerase sigma factor (sigma-70 family)
MTDLLSDIATPSDAELISSVRGGDVAAYGELFARHRDAANRLARQLVRGPDADDLVSEAFAKVLSVLQGGGGPDVAFRAYLLTAVRRLHVDKMRAGAKVQTSDDMEVFDPGVPFHDTAIASFESGAAAKAFASLPERWQLVLWHLEVEGNKPADIAPLLGMSPNSVSALAYRAREGLRQAFLTMHLNDISETECRWVNEHLGAYVRKGLSNRDTTKVQAHLDQCRRCTAMYLELTEVNSNLAAIIAPLLLGGAAAGYIASTTGAAAGGFGLTALVGRVRDVVSANAGAVTVGGVAAGVVAATAVGAMLLPNTPERVVGADQPVTSTVPAPSEGTSKLPEVVEEREKRPADEVTDESPSPTEETTPEAAAAPVTLPGADPTTAEPGPTEEPAPTEEPSPEPEPSQEPEPEPEPSEEPAPEPQPSEEPAPVPTDEPTSAPPTTTEPTSPPTTDPPPTTPTTPPPPVLVDADVDVSGTTVDDSGVHLSVTGSPALPPSVTVRLISSSGTVQFAEGPCALSENGTTATCLTGATATGGPGQPAMADLATGAPFTADLLFANLESQPGDVTLAVEVTVPEGYQDPDDTNNVSSSHVSRAADMVLSLPASVDAKAAGRHEFTGTVVGVPADYDEPVVYSLGGDESASFATPPGSSCDASDDGRTLTCGNTGDRVDFVVHTDPATKDPVDVTITVAPLTGYRDPDRTNNANPARLSPFVPLAFAEGPTATLDANNQHVVRARLSVPAGTTALELVLPDPQNEFEVDPQLGCPIEQRETEDVMVCSVPAGATDMAVAFRAKLPAGRGDLIARAGDDQQVRASIRVTP